MLALIVSAALVCAGAVLVGQLAMRLCGAREWSWSAPAVGIAVLMLVAMLALHLPGRAVTTAVLLGALLIAGIVNAVREPAQRMPLSGLLAGLPVLLAALVPFVGAGRAGTLGVGFNNDMASHLLWAEGIRFEQVERVNEVIEHYPLGPHALAASLSEALVTRIDLAFAGLHVAIPVLLGWTALGAMRSSGLVRRCALALVVGIPFIIAGYYGQGSFKELLQALFSLALVLMLTRGLLPTLWRWVPPGLLFAGVLSVYSAPGLGWPLAVLGAWVAGSLAIDVWRCGSARNALRVARENVLPLLTAFGVVLVLLIPQLARVWRFVDETAGTNATGIDDSSLGNLVARIPLWPAFGVWDQPDYRLPMIDAFETGMWTAFVLGLAVFGALWCIRRGQWLVPVSAALFLAIWAFSDRTQSPYVAAKALVMLAPLLMLLAALPLLDRETEAERGQMPSWWRWAAPLLALTLVVKVGLASWHALRIAPVGPTAHLQELRELRDEGGLQGERVLFLGNDDFVRWAMAGVLMNGPVISFQTLDTRPQKTWQYGQSLDFDSLPPQIYNEYGWVIAPRDAASSAVPEGLKLERSTDSFDLYRRAGKVPDRRVLNEGDQPGAILRCSTREGRRILRAGGLAGIREAPVGVALPVMEPGASATVTLPLEAGTWDLVMPYVSSRPLTVEVQGEEFELPANLDRPGVRLPVGTIEVERAGPVPVTVTSDETPATPRAAIAYPTAIIAVRQGTARTVPVAQACGKYVDWLSPAA